jgi:hypothetical protein
MSRQFTPPSGGGSWRLIGNGATCTFCGCAKVEATVGAPDAEAKAIFNIGICADCLCDTILWRFSEVKAKRIAQLAMDMGAAADEIVKERRKFAAERNRRREIAHYRELASAPRRQENAAEHELEEQRRFGETVEETKARLEADLETWERTAPQRLAEAELRIRTKFGLLEDTPLHDSTRRGDPLL